MLPCIADHGRLIKEAECHCADADMQHHLARHEPHSSTWCQPLHATPHQ